MSDRVSVTELVCGIGIMRKNGVNQNRPVPPSPPPPTFSSVITSKRFILGKASVDRDSIPCKKHSPSDTLY